MAFFIDSAGNVVEGPDDARTAAALGYAPASEEQVASAQANAAREAEFGATGSLVRGELEGVARGATFGLSDLAARGLGADAEDMAARRELSSGVGEFAGALAPIVLSGGTGALGTAARLAPTALASRGAALAGEALVGAAPTLGRTIARTVASEAVEAVPYALGEVITEASLGNKDLTAEGVLADVGLSALLSGGAGAILGGAAVAVPKAIRKARDVVERGEKASTAFVEKWLPRTGESLSGVDPATQLRSASTPDGLSGGSTYFCTCVVLHAALHLAASLLGKI